MEKVKLTQEQAREIERIKKYFNRHEYITKFVETNGVSDSELHIEELVRALYIGYEVEPGFKAGDWVHNNLNRCVFQIKEDQLEVINDDPRTRDIRHATKQEIWWASHGRGVWELREGDVLKADDGGYLVEVCEVFDSRNVRLTGGTMHVEVNELKEGYKVIYFAEDRKDLGDD